MKGFSFLLLGVSMVAACSSGGSGGSGGGSTVLASKSSASQNGGSVAGGASSSAGGTSQRASSLFGGRTDSGGGSVASTAGSSATTNSSSASAGGTRDTSNSDAGVAAGGTISHAGTTGRAGATGGSAGAGGSAVDARPADLAPFDGAGDLANSVRETGGDVASSQDAGVYNPCPRSGEACKILPFGDSITWGQQDEANAGYRGPLFGRAVKAGQKITFTGSQSNGPDTVQGQPFPKNNEGHPGWPIDPGFGSYGPDGISELVPTPAFSVMPQIVLLMIGTNDLYAKSGQAEMPNRLGSLLDKIIATAPDALLVVAKITPWVQYAQLIKTYNDAIPGLVQERKNKGKHIVWVDMNTDFNVSTMLSSDGCHPNTTGYRFMADQWYATIGDLLPK